MSKMCAAKQQQQQQQPKSVINLLKITKAGPKDPRVVALCEKALRLCTVASVHFKKIEEAT